MSNAVVNQYYAMPTEAPDNDGWKPLEYPGVREGYRISTAGEIMGDKGQLLKASLNGSQLYVTLRYADGGSGGVRLDRLMMGNFVGPPIKEGEVPIHLDGDLSNCRLDNLRYGPPPPRTPHNKGKKMRPYTSSPKVAKGEYDDIEVLRIYRHKGTGLSVSVGDDGKAKLPKVNLSADEVWALALISQRISEMNTVLGLGK